MDDLDLSSRAVAAGWKWQAGAVRLGPPGEAFRVWRCVGPDQWAADDGATSKGPLSGLQYGPDFNDAATRGVLLQQVRERWRDCTVWAMVDCDDEAGSWLCIGLDCGQIGSGPSETAALVAALEAAPERK